MNPILKNLCIIALFLPAIILQAQNSERDTIKEHQYELQLKALDSSMVGTFRKATIAMDQGDQKLADSLYAIVVTKVPDFDVALRRLGSLRAQLGNPYGGIELCKKAVDMNRSAYNLLSLADCYIFYDNYRDLDQALLLLNEARRLPEGDDVSILAALGQIYMEDNDISDFRSITTTLDQKYPNEMVTHYYAAILAAADSKWVKAKKEIMQAKELGLNEETVQGFINSGVGRKVALRSFAIGFIWVVIAWAIGILLLFVIGKVLSNMTLRSIENDSLTEEGNKKGHSLRSFYRTLINIGGIYYYISLPIVLILVVALVAALVYLFIMAGHIPIKLLLILVVGACVTIYAMIRSLLVKVKLTDPGRELKKEEAPKLYDLTAEVSTTINTRAVDEIRITQGTDLAVYERGTWKEKLGDKAQRILIVGIGVLKDFKKDDFKAVLAHEYGHFSHRDTAGGEIALRVMNDMNKYVYTLYQNGQTVWYNLAFQFFRLYSFIFRRISHGSTRLQEVMADRVAAESYGKLAFQNGLTHVIKRDIEFIKLVNKEIEEVKKEKRSMNNFYDIPGPSDGTVEAEFEKAMKAPTSEDDTHPSPVDRFRYISKINVPDTINDSTLVTDLFINWETITREMTELIESKINKG
jgi:Zn-dependent protease with chaperone function